MAERLSATEISTAISDSGGCQVEGTIALDLDQQSLFIIPKSEPLAEEVQFEFDRDSLDPTVQSLLRRVGILEAQIGACLESQPLLYRVFDKVNALEQRIKTKTTTKTKTLKVHLKRSRRRRRFPKSVPDPDLTRVTRSVGRNLTDGSKEEDIVEDNQAQTGSMDDNYDSRPIFLAENNPITPPGPNDKESQSDHLENVHLMDVVVDEIGGGDDFDPLRSDQEDQEDNEDDCNHAKEEEATRQHTDTDHDTTEVDANVESSSNPKFVTENKLKVTTAIARQRNRERSTSKSSQCSSWSSICSTCNKQIGSRNWAEHEFYHRFDSAISAAAAVTVANLKTDAEGDLTADGALAAPKLSKRRCLEPFCAFVGTGRESKRNVHRHYQRVHPTCAFLRPYACKVCPPKGRETRFKTEFDLAKHYIQTHPIVHDFHIEGGAGASILPKPRPGPSRPSIVSARAPVTCDECGRQCKNDESLKRHQKAHHRGRTHSFACPLPECGKRFSNQWAVDLHMFRVHTGGPFKCRICSREFRHPANFTRHERVHTGERPFACPVEGCGKAYPTDQSLRIHSLLHTGKPYTCDECGWQFQTEQHLRSHKKNHDKGTATAGHIGVARRRNL